MADTKAPMDKVTLWTFIGLGFGFFAGLLLSMSPVGDLAGFGTWPWLAVGALAGAFIGWGIAKAKHGSPTR
jgi:hypothetical protein